MTYKLNVENMTNEEFANALCKLYGTCNDINLDNVKQQDNTYMGYISYK